MMLAEALVTFQWGWPHMHHLFALLCLVAVVYKLIIAFGKRRDVFRHFERFSGPPGHWLLGHVLEVSHA